MDERRRMPSTAAASTGCNSSFVMMRRRRGRSSITSRSLSPSSSLSAAATAAIDSASSSSYFSIAKRRGRGGGGYSPGFKALAIAMMVLLMVGGCAAFRVAAALRSLSLRPSSTSSSREAAGAVAWGNMATAGKGIRMFAGGMHHHSPRGGLSSSSAARRILGGPNDDQQQQHHHQRGGSSSFTTRSSMARRATAVTPPLVDEKIQEEEEEEMDIEEDEGELEDKSRQGSDRKKGSTRERAGATAEWDDGAVPSDEDLQEIVSQRGQELARMNGAASHLALAHTIWGQVLRPGGIAVDATCGNGHDSLALARFLFPTDVSESTYGRLYCIDIQEEAIAATRRQLLEKSGPPLSEGEEALLDKYVNFYVQNFREFPEAIPSESVSLLVYNLGYLPGHDKTRTTKTEDTLQSLREALFIRPILAVRGLVSIMCYRGHPEGAKEASAVQDFVEGHPEGAKEAAAVQDFVEGLDPMVFRCFMNAPLNRPLSPALITIYRLK